MSDTQLPFDPPEPPDLPPIVEAQSTLDGEPQTNEERFEAFHAANPHVFFKLRDIARQARAKGATRFGIAAAFERLRWLYLETHGDTFRLNNTYRAFYARLLMERVPDLRGFFNTRGDD